MTGPDLPDDVRRLIRSSVPAIDALEVLVLRCRSGRSFTATEITSGIPTINSPEPILAEYLRLLKSQGIVAESDGGSFSDHPASAEIEEAVRHLLAAYDQRPVTLIRTIYAIAQSRNIQTFADAFRLRSPRRAVAYLPRVIGYLLILYAIIRTNVATSRSNPVTSHQPGEAPDAAGGSRE